MSQHNPIVIVSAIRTPMGSFQGSFRDVRAPDLGATAIAASLSQTKIAVDDIDEVIMGCVLSAGVGQAPARQAALAARLPYTTHCTTINKMCGSGMKAVMLAHDSLQAESNNIIIAGGMESMSNAPYLLPKARDGYRLGHQTTIDHMLFDGLEDAYDKGKAMGYFAEETAKFYDIDRETQDAFAISSLTRAQQAVSDGSFHAEIAEHCIKHPKGDRVIDTDESPSKAKLEKIPLLKPVFQEKGTVTAANSSSISDGAAALVMMRESTARKKNLPILARISAHATHAQQPNWFTTAPVNAIKKVVEKAKWSLDAVDLFEINEAFAIVTLVAMQQLAIPVSKVNIHGGACALGHPIGASGARIIVTLIHALRKYNLSRGIAALCIGGGEATAIALEVD
jgi:acetyl-CoA C-acetyltransferase